MWHFLLLSLWLSFIDHESGFTLWLITFVWPAQNLLAARKPLIRPRFVSRDAIPVNSSLPFFFCGYLMPLSFTYNVGYVTHSSFSAWPLIHAQNWSSMLSFKYCGWLAYLGVFIFYIYDGDRKHVLVFSMFNSSFMNSPPPPKRMKTCLALCHTRCG